MLKQWTLALALLLCTGQALAQATASGDHVTVRWLAPEALAAKESQPLGFYFEVDPEWHVYWRNAGDSGAAPRFDMAVQGAEAGPIQWPYPQRLPIEHLTNLGYEGNVAYLFNLAPEAGAESVELTVDLEWLVCKVDCIPGFGKMNLNLPVEPEARWQESERERLNTFAARVPRSAEASPWQAASLLTGSNNALWLHLQGEGDAPQVFPLDGALLGAGKPDIEPAEGGYRYRFERQPGAALPATTGFVIAQGGSAWELPAVALGSQAPQQGQAQALWLLLLAAFAGGLILNLMPCVFPVLSIKLFGLINSGASGGARTREGLLYSSGVLVTFAALGALLLALRAGGAAIGWGFQLQSPAVVLALIVLFWLMALAFSGVFEFGHKLMSLAGNASGGSFVTGVLAVFVAAPCTGPFMGAALGAAAILPAASAMAIFLGLGAGLAAPFLLLTLSPALLSRLPRPGPWMDRLRQFFAFPLYATVIWLAWVLGRLLGDSGWLIACALALWLTFCLWLGGQSGRAWRFIGTGAAAAGLIAAFAYLPAAGDANSATAGQSLWQGYDRARIERALAERRPVFIDYTAAWCITCQVNKKLVLDTAHTSELFAKHNVLAIRADWTRHDPAITEALAELGRNSVPVYAWYAPGTDTPKLLPQLLQERMMTELFQPPSGDQ
ncbi:protein-disulfide reductase DsbD family protein [Gilvimarinus algae]|uniref:Protein-disulfide reductase DsbD family protein n=1 Tax=Gilvimarinus algae TaxID=3058037 RepID=A0ABT8TEE4_9GAMM|nr:protein-disulfide reductase DsbD domain-containing protein [Gilvimarinus sp. SDUM040014]MDO3380667.1 protein-disulfide reductase DsbD family protein [Gilvimarinus sp. SDUM040014]